MAAYVVRFVVALARHSALLSRRFAGGHVKADGAAVDGVAGDGSGGSVVDVARG